jgi:hypothetical protein
VIDIAYLLPSLEYKCETCFDNMIGIAEEEEELWV